MTALLLEHWFVAPLIQAVGLVVAIILPWHLPIRYTHWSPNWRYLGHAMSFVALAILYNCVFPDGIRRVLESLDTPEMLIFSSEERAGGRLVGVFAFAINLLVIAKWGDPNSKISFSNSDPKGQTPNPKRSWGGLMKVYSLIFFCLMLIFGIPQFFGNSAFTRFKEQGVFWNESWSLEPEWVPYSEIKSVAFEKVTYISQYSRIGRVSSSGGGRVTELRTSILLQDGRQLLVRESGPIDREWVTQKNNRLAEFLQARGVAIGTGEPSGLGGIQDRIRNLKIDLPCPDGFANCGLNEKTVPDQK